MNVTHYAKVQTGFQFWVGY